MKNHINNKLGLFYYSTTQQIKRNEEVSYNYNPLKIDIRQSNDRNGYVIVLSDILTKQIVEIIESERFDADSSRQTNFYGKTDKRQAVILWDAPVTVGLAKTNVAGFDLLINIFNKEEALSLVPSVENALEFLRSTAPLVQENGYSQEDLWGRMRYCMIQYILRYAPQYQSQISFISSIESNQRIDYSDIFDYYLADTFEMIAEECDRCALEMIKYEKAGDKNRFYTYRNNVAMFTGVYSTLIYLLG